MLGCDGFATPAQRGQLRQEGLLSLGEAAAAAAVNGDGSSVRL